MHYRGLKEPEEGRTEEKNTSSRRNDVVKSETEGREGLGWCEMGLHKHILSGFLKPGMSIWGPVIALQSLCFQQQF